MEPLDFHRLPQYVLAVLALRRGAPLSRYRQRRALRRRLGDAPPRPSFWKRLCAVLWPGENLPAEEDLLAWLRLPPERQWEAVLRAWVRIPRHPAARKRRRKLLIRLRQRPAPALRAAERRELPGLRYLGLWEDGRLTPLGEMVFGYHPAPPAPAPLPWRFAGETLTVSLPADWLLLWNLEAFLEPRAPGEYPLGKKALKRLPLKGGAARLWELLTRGLGGPPPPELRARLEGAQALHILPGLLLAFPSAAALAHLRREPPLRKRLERLISPRHVLLTPQERRQLEPLLARRGIWLREAGPPPVAPHRRNRQPLHPLALPLPGEDLSAALEDAIRQERAVQIYYRPVGPGRRAEWRHVTPLLLEQRGAHTYLVAYCHDRRANRLFRLDRILPVREAANGHE